MSLNKRIVWLPYDMDTAIGSDNQGALIFNYNLEDTDMIGTEGVFNGSTSVMWNNIRDAFPDEIQTMYQNLRSSGALSYDLVEQMFENHQNKWPEAIFNEDAMYKYIQPLINDNDGQYLSMALGSKAEQRKWWLYNRFKYIDSKYSGGESLTDVITLRPGALDSGITITPYADLYVAVRWDNDTTKIRTTRGVPTTIACPYSTVGNNVVNILNASQLSSVGDLSGFKCRSANFVKASRLQYIKVGDSTEGYDNPNLLELLIGNNTLLTTVDARNCSSLTATIDLSGASNIEEAYFDGTKIAGVSLPNGGILRVLHLPNTVRNLTIRNQQNITDFVLDDYSMISSLRLENCDILMDKAIDIVNNMQTGNIRLIGINWDFENGSDFKTTFNKIDKCSGIDDTETGYIVPTAQLTGTVHTPIASDRYLRTLVSRYPYVTFTADELTNIVKQYLEGSLTEYEDDEAETISAYAFYNMTSLMRVNAPNVNTIASNAFSQCRNLVGVSFPNVTRLLGEGVFSGCDKLEYASFPKLTGSTHNYLFQTASGSGRTYSLKWVDLGFVSSIDSRSFFNQDKLQYLFLRNSTIVSSTGNLPNISTVVFVPSSLVAGYSNATNWSALTNLTFKALEDYTLDGTTTGEINWDKIHAEEVSA